MKNFIEIAWINTVFGEVMIGQLDKKPCIRFNKSVYETFETAESFRVRLIELRTTKKAA